MPFPVETRTSWVNVLGYAASVAVLATFFMSTMIPLRIVALARNLPFCAYGYLDHLYPVLFLHAALFPVNLWRPTQFQRLVRDVRRSHRKDLSLKHLLPYMKKRSCATGETLVRKGEKADRLYYLAKGALEIVEIGKVLKPGAFFGEIGVFARNQERTATIECRTDCRLYELSEWKAKEPYLHDRSFGFAALRLIIDRLVESNLQPRQEGAA